MEVKEKTKQLRLRFYNVVIHPASKHEPQFYIDLYEKVFKQTRTYDIGNGKRTKMRSFSKSAEMIHGTLINYTTLDNDNWYNESSDEVVTHETEPNIYPNAKEWDFFFYPEKHRMAVVIKQGVSWSQFENYFNKAFADACDALGYDEVKLTQETSQEGIDEIFALESIESLEVEISYSNNDINDITAAAIDDEFKNSNVSTIKTKVTGVKGNPLTLIADKYLGALVKLSKHNGYAKATGKVGHRVKKVNTRDYPKVSTLKQVTSNNLLQSIRDAIISIL